MSEEKEVTREQFDVALEEIVAGMSGAAVLATPGIFDVLREAFEREDAKRDEDDRDDVDESDLDALSRAYEARVQAMPAEDILAIPGVYEVLSEDLNNDAIERAKENADAE